MTGTPFLALPRAAPVAAIVYISESPPPQVSGALIRRGYSVLERSWASGAEDLLDELQPDVVIFYLDPVNEEDRRLLLEVTDPGSDSTAVLVVAPNGDDQAVLAALNAGADACLGSSVMPEVLAAQVDALYHRSRRRPTASEDLVIAVRDLLVDFARRRVTRTGRALPLTRTEFDILGVLVRNPGRVVSGTEVLSAIGQFVSSEAQARLIVKVHLSHLRQKLGAHPSGREYVQTIRGVGYLLDRREADFREMDSSPETHDYAGTSELTPRAG